MHPAVQLHPATPTVSKTKLVLKEHNQVAVQRSYFTVFCFPAISQWNITPTIVVSFFWLTGSFFNCVQDLTCNSKEKEQK